MNNLNVNFENLTEKEKAQLLAIVEKSQTKNDPMEFKPGEQCFLVGVRGNTVESCYRNDAIDKELISFGSLYHTKEQAETAAKAMRRFNRILQFAILHGGYREFSVGQVNYSIYFSNHEKCYKPFSTELSEYQCVFMKFECAELLCEKLNSGEYTL